MAPAEVDFAAEVGVAYAAGGQARKGLLPRPNVQPGAFGPGIYAVDLPLILRALADAGNALVPLLSGPYLSNILAAGSLLVAMRADRGPAAEPDRPETRTAAQPEPSPEPPPPLTPPAPAPVMSERRAIELALASLRERLVSAGFPPERADELAYDLLDELLKDTAEAAVFVDELSAVPDDGARSKSSAKTRGKWARRNSRP